MTQPGLMQISPELVDKLRRSADETRHRIVERACLLAVQRADVVAPALTTALDLLHLRRFGDPDLRSQIDRLVQELDEVAWDIQDRVEAGDTTDGEYRRAFVRARAAAAIGFALDGSLAGSFDSLYEAYYAIDSRDDYMRIVVD